MMRNKKGSLQDILFIAIVVTFFSMIVLFGFYFTSQVNDVFQSKSDDLVTPLAKTASTTLTGHYPGVIDNSFLFLVVGMAMVALALAAFVRVHPIFIPFFIIGWIALTYVCGLFSNIYQEMAANAQLAPYATQLTFINSILTFLPMIVGVVGILMMVVLYKTNDQTI